MKNFYLILFLSGAGLAVFPQSAPADDWNKETKITFSGPVELPNKVLPAGTYEFKLLDSPTADRDIVLIYNANETRIEDSLLAIPDQRFKVRDKTLVQFYEAPAGSPQAIKAWFYPGQETGLAFVYPHNRAVSLAKASNESVYSTNSDLTPYATKSMKAGDADATNLKHSKVRRVQPDGTENEVNSPNQ